MDIFGFKKRAKAKEDYQQTIDDAEHRITRLYSIAANKSNTVGDDSQWDGWRQIEEHKKTLEAHYKGDK